MKKVPCRYFDEHVKNATTPDRMYAFFGPSAQIYATTYMTDMSSTVAYHNN